MKYITKILFTVHNLLKNWDIERKTENLMEKNCEKYFKSHVIYDVIHYYHQNWIVANERTFYGDFKNVYFSYICVCNKEVTKQNSKGTSIFYIFKYFCSSRKSYTVTYRRNSRQFIIYWQHSFELIDISVIPTAIKLYLWKYIPNSDTMVYSFFLKFEVSTKRCSQGHVSSKW